MKHNHSIKQEFISEGAANKFLKLAVFFFAWRRTLIRYKEIEPINDRLS